MDIKGVKKISAAHYFSNAQIVKAKIEEDSSQVIKAISSNESAFKQKVEEMLIDISNATNPEFIKDCFDVLSLGEKHTKLVQEKITTMAGKVSERITEKEKTEGQVRQANETQSVTVENTIEKNVVEVLEKQILDGPKEMQIKERNPLDVVYDGIEDETETKTVEHMDDLTSYEVSYV